MKKSLALILLTPWLAFATLPSGVQWEVRTTGADTNGGGFVSGASGTDRSQSDTPFCTSADLAAATTTVTSVSCPFSAASVGNIIQITAGGCTAGFYQVVSVSVVTATLDRSAGTASSCTFALGGGLLTIGKLLPSVPVVGNTIWIKAGTYTITSHLQVTTVADNGVGPLTFEGYNSTHGDLGTKPLITTSTNSVDMWDFNQGSSSGGYAFINLSMSNTAGTRGNGLIANTATKNVLINKCLLDGFSHGIQGDFAAVFSFQGLFVWNTEIKNSTSHGIINSQNTTILNSYIHDNTGDGYNTSARTDQIQQVNVVSSVFYKNGANGFNNSSLTNSNLDMSITNSVFSDSTAAGILIQNGNAIQLLLSNNILYNNGTYGVNLQHNSDNGIANYSNAYGANTTAARNNLTAGTGDVTLTADPFVGRTSANFALNSTAGGGTAAKAAGFPGVMPAGTGFVDIGALDTQCAAGGGTSACAFAQ